MATTSRADKFTVENKKVTYFSDFTTNLDINPLTGYLAKVTNEESVKQALKSLILTQRTERFMQPWMGSKIFSMLFEPHGPLTDIALEQEIRTTVLNCEPRVKLEEVRSSGGQDGDDNTLHVTLVFTINTVPDELFTTDIILDRRR